MDNKQHQLPALTFSLSESPKSLKVSIDWEKNTTSDEILRLMIVAVYEDMSDLIIQAIRERGAEKEDINMSQGVINKFLQAQKVLYQQGYHHAPKSLAVDPEDVFKNPQRPTI